ncbi:hypothetical protein Cgig2_006113 [Carnegiea gigantea]|uniref:Exonuclease domain-containing protein n=1 Tax=Carnegiea gigantea TaxID=171969 RepID=A0A9Q1QR66_9CARY|nr:hypothetical protein Cgig2_006113 [Carnegiea gigantea]
MAEERSEIVFFDVETTVPTRPGQGFAILEFGAILVCPRTLVELENYSTLVRPCDLSLISLRSERCNGISRDAASTAPSFSDIADKVFDILHAFAEIGRPVPEPKGTIDSLALLTERFGRRAGNMKMATLATYFGLGQQKHRSLDDVRMNLEVLKYCATVLFLESSLPDILVSNDWVSPSTTTRRTRSGGRVLPVEISETPNSSSSPGDLVNQTLGAKILDFVEHARSETDSFNMRRLSEELMANAAEVGNSREERPLSESPEISHRQMAPEGCSSSSTFLTPEEVYVSSIKASLFPFYRGCQRIQVLHKDDILKLFCTPLKVRFGLSTKFVDKAGRPRLSFVINAPPGLCQVLDACENHVHNLFVQSGSTSDWRSVITRKDGYWNFPTVRLHIPTVVTGDVANFGTEIFLKDAASGVEQKLVFSKLDAAELDSLLTPGTTIDAFFSLDPYDYQQNAGIRLVAQKLVIHSK